MTTLNLLAERQSRLSRTTQQVPQPGKAKRKRLSLIILLLLLLVLLTLILFGERFGVPLLSHKSVNTLNMLSQTLTLRNAEGKTLSEHPQVFVSKVPQSIRGNISLTKDKGDAGGREKGWELVWRIEREKGACLSLLSKLDKSLPPLVWIVSIIVTSEGDYFVQGITFSPTRAIEFVNRLEQTSHVEDVQLPSITRGQFGASEAFLFTVLGTIQGPFERISFSRRPVFFAKEAYIDRFLDSLNKVGEKYGLTLTEANVDSLMPKREGVRNEGLYVKGSYQQLVSFLDYLTHCPEAVSISRLVVLSAVAQDPSFDQINASLFLNFYR